MFDALLSNFWAMVTVAAVAMAVLAWAGDWRRERRRHLEAVGFMPWTAIMVLSMVVALAAAALAIVRG